MLETTQKEMTDTIQLTLDRKAKQRTVIANILPVAGLIFCIILFAVATQGNFISSSNLGNLVSQGFTMILVAAGASFIYSTGSIDMSIGSVLGLAQIVAGTLLAMDYPGWIGLVAAIVTAFVCTSVTSLLYSILRVPPFVASLCMMNICNGIISWVVEDGDVYITYSKFSNWDSVVIKGIILAVTLVGCFVIFTRTRVGKDAKALGGNPVTAVISGVKRIRAAWYCYAIMGICIGIAAFWALIRTCRVSSGSPTLALNVLTAVALGGFPLRGGAKAKFPAAIIGAVTVTVLTNGLTLMGLDPAVTLAVKGVLFLAVVGATADRSQGKLIK